MGENRSLGRVRNSSSTRYRLYKWMESMKAVLTDNITYHIKANHTPLPDKKPVKYCNEDDRSLIVGWDRHTHLARLNRLTWPQLSCWTHCLVYRYFWGFLYHWCCVHFNCMRLLHDMTIQSHLPWRAALYKGKVHDLSGFGHVLFTLFVFVCA